MRARAGVRVRVRVKVCLVLGLGLILTPNPNLTRPPRVASRRSRNGTNFLGLSLTLTLAPTLTLTPSPTLTLTLTLTLTSSKLVSHDIDGLGLGSDRPITNDWLNRVLELSYEVGTGLYVWRFLLKCLMMASLDPVNRAQITRALQVWMPFFALTLTP